MARLDDGQSVAGVQETDVATFPATQNRQQSDAKLPVTKEISPLGRKRLCRALMDEYMMYSDLVERAVNLDDTNGKRHMI